MRDRARGRALVMDRARERAGDREMVRDRARDGARYRVLGRDRAMVSGTELGTQHLARQGIGLETQLGMALETEQWV